MNEKINRHFFQSLYGIKLPFFCQNVNINARNQIHNKLWGNSINKSTFVIAFLFEKGFLTEILDGLI